MLAQIAHDPAVEHSRIDLAVLQAAKEYGTSKKTRNGEVLYYHQLLAAVIMHPELKHVLPLIPEAALSRMRLNGARCGCDRRGQAANPAAMACGRARVLVAFRMLQPVA